VLSGGVGNPDTLRQNEDAVEFVKAFFEAGKPVAVICHGPWTLIEADVVRGRKLVVPFREDRPAQRRRELAQKTRTTA
jgi:putative intracellular protease/amidase